MAEYEVIGPTDNAPDWKDDGGVPPPGMPRKGSNLQGKSMQGGPTQGGPTQGTTLSVTGFVTQDKLAETGTTGATAPTPEPLPTEEGLPTGETKSKEAQAKSKKPGKAKEAKDEKKKKASIPVLAAGVVMFVGFFVAFMLVAGHRWMGATFFTGLAFEKVDE